MKRLKDEKKTIYMIIQTHEGALDSSVEFFEQIPIFPDWIKEIKLLFTWSMKSILKEKNQYLQKSLIRGDYIQSQKYPSYIMNLEQSHIYVVVGEFKALLTAISFQ